MEARPDPRIGTDRPLRWRAFECHQCAAGWRALREYAAGKLGVKSDACKGTTFPFASWASLEEQFMKERGFVVHYPANRVSLCDARQEAASRDAAHNHLSSGDDVVAALHMLETAT